MKEFKPVGWQFGILADRNGHVHVGAVVGGGGAERAEYVDLLAPVGSSRPADLELERLVVLVNHEQVADLRRLAETCIDDVRLRDQLVKLADLVAVQTARTSWTA